MTIKTKATFGNDAAWEHYHGDSIAIAVTETGSVVAWLDGDMAATFAPGGFDRNTVHAQMIDAA